MLRRPRRALLLVATTMLAGCLAQFGGEPESPEIDAIRNDLHHSPMARIEAYDACDKTDKPIIACMQQAGYRVIQPADDPRAGDCQELIDSGDDLPAYCFVAGGTPGGK